MSGDVQPRKRKDKRRKKADGEYTIQRIRGAGIDDEDTGTPPPTLISPPDTPAENVTIHVYKESSTGGHWCARIVFFVLLAALVGLIGIIIFEHRGTTDVDTPVASSRWASIFEGWVDDSPSSHGDEPHDQEGTAEGSEEALEEEEEKRDHNEEESAEAEKQGEESAEEDEGIGEEEEEEEEKETEEEEERSVEEEEEELEQEEEEEEEETEEDNEVESKEDQEEEEDEGIDEGEIDEEINDDSRQEFDIPGVLEEIDDTSENENTDEENDATNDFDMELDADADIDDSPEENDNDESEEFTGIPGVNDIDDNSAEPLEEIEGEESEENINDGDSESEEEEEIEEESTSVPMKFGIGVALVVAAHFVLVRRWNNVHDITDVADLARRNTIVPPPHVKQVIKSAENIEDKVRAQVEAYEDLKSKYDKLQEENVSLTDLENLIPRKEAGQIKKKDKRSTRGATKEEITAKGSQSKVISSEEEDEEEDYEGEELETSEGERVSGAEEYEEEQAEGEEEEEEEDEEEEDEENVDDSELIAKLEAKYGKLPTPQDSEEEEVEEESEEEEEEGEDDELPEWKRVKAPKDSRVESQPRRPMQQAGMKTKHADTSQAKSGGRTNDFSNVSNIDDIIIYEENDSTISQVGKEFLN